SNSTISSTPMQQYSPSTFDEFQSFNRTGSPNFQQQQNEQHLFRLSLGNIITMNNEKLEILKQT
ncbi:unnamed protein product, partial [Rotaria magnacalcarata]